MCWSCVFMFGFFTFYCTGIGVNTGSYHKHITSTSVFVQQMLNKTGLGTCHFHIYSYIQDLRIRLTCDQSHYDISNWLFYEEKQKFSMKRGVVSDTCFKKKHIYRMAEYVTTCSIDSYYKNQHRLILKMTCTKLITRDHWWNIIRIIAIDITLVFQYCCHKWELIIFQNLLENQSTSAYYH